MDIDYLFKFVYTFCILFYFYYYLLIGFIQMSPKDKKNKSHHSKTRKVNHIILVGCLFLAFAFCFPSHFLCLFTW